MRMRDGDYRMRVEGVDLSKSTGLTNSQLEIACGDNDTKLPPGLERPDAWPCDH